MPVEYLILVCVTFVVGGIFKGATGIGAPLVAIPTMAILVDVPFAVAVFLVPNIVSNAWQTWQFRKHDPDGKFAWKLAIPGMVGAGGGTLVLAKFSGTALMNGVAVLILLFVAFRLRNPKWSLSWPTANRLVVPVGVFGGFLQGSTGLSAPIAVTFMSSVNLRREEFIYSMSLFFFTMTLVQAPVQIGLGVLSWERFAYGVAALIPLFVGMSVGGALGKRLPKSVFDMAIIAILTLLALRLLASNFLV